jgi:hydroxymethylbilane synthase
MTQNQIIRIGTRGSKLALTQANLVKDKLQSLGYGSELVVIKTTGDQVLNKPLYDIGGKALFLKEIEEALLKNEVDLAVHSMKDVPGELPEGLMISSVLEREDPRDVFVSKYPDIKSLPKGARVGTSSVRRKVQLLKINPLVETFPLRGNIDSRINKYLEGEFDAIILANAGLHRLNITHYDFKVIPFEDMVPAVGQGVIALEIRTEDKLLYEITQKLNHQQTYIELQAERGFLETLQGSCRTPLGAIAQMHGDKLNVHYFLADDDGSNIRKAVEECDASKAYEAGVLIAKRLKRSVG